MNVLIPTDGSKYAKWATEWVGRMPFIEVPFVTILHVTDIGSLRGPFMFQSVVAGTEPFVQEEIKRIEARRKGVLAAAERQMDSLNMKGKILSERGPVSQTILERAAKRDGLIALGSRGLDALDRLLLGSVSTRVALHATCSVLIVKKPARLLHRILFATDGSKESNKALKFLLTKLQAQTRKGDGPIEVVVMYVIPFRNYPKLEEDGGHLVKNSVVNSSRAACNLFGLDREKTGSPLAPHTLRNGRVQGIEQGLKVSLDEAAGADSQRRRTHRGRRHVCHTVSQLSEVRGRRRPCGKKFRREADQGRLCGPRSGTNGKTGR